MKIIASLIIGGFLMRHHGLLEFILTFLLVYWILGVLGF